MSIWLNQIIIGATTSLTIVSGAVAQEAIDDAQQVQRVEITGTNIRRVDMEISSPVQVITADDIKKSGHTSVSEILRNITANGQGTLSNVNSEAFAGGASGIALRGLTVGSTLVLIDGHRMAPYPLSDDAQRQFVDITSIPFDAVERIEILKDGASAVYGSDALAGVVNVILKKSYSGTSMMAETGTTEHGGGSTAHATLMHGFGNLNEDGYTGYVNLEYRHANSIYMDQRSGPWTNVNWATVAPGGSNLTAGVPNSFNGGFPPTKTPYLFNPSGPNGAANPANYQFLGAGCDAGAIISGAGCPYPNSWELIQPPTQNMNFLASLTKRIGSDWEMHVKGSVFDSKGQQSAANNVNGAPTQSFPGPSFAGNVAVGTGAVAEGLGQYPQPGVGAISNFVIQPGLNGNPFGVPAIPYGQIAGVGGPLQEFDSRNYRLVADFRGSLGPWDLSSSLGYTKVSTRISYSNFVNYTNLLVALNQPNGSPNQFKLSGGNSATVMNSVAPHFSSVSTDELDFAEARASRTMMKLAGGDLSMSLGTEFVHKALNSPLAAPAGLGQVGGAYDEFGFGQENDAAIYTEFFAPVSRSLEFDGAARLDDYDTYGTSFNPKIGFKATPNGAIGIRGTASTGFRAPNSTEIGRATSYYLLSNTIADPILCPGGSPKANGVYPAQCAVTPYYVQTTSAKLNPEKSRSFTLGMILEPIKGWGTSIDYYNIQIRNQVIPASELGNLFHGVFVRNLTPTAQAQVINGVVTPAQTPPVGNIALALAPYANANTTTTSGIEMATQYKFRFGDLGNLTSSLDYTYIMQYDITAGGVTYHEAGTHGPNGVSGDTGNPKGRAQLIFSYDRGPLNITTTLNWISQFSVTDPSASAQAASCQTALIQATTYFIFTNPGTIPDRYCHVASFLDTDLSVKYSLSKDWSVHASVLNLFDRAPPVDAQTYGGGYFPYDPALHQAGAIGRFFSAGVTYAF